MVADGYTVFDFDQRVANWAKAAWSVAQGLDLTPDRCGGTWHVGVDALPNDADGSIDGVPLSGPWDLSCDNWHRAQLSVICPGYPRQDPSESDAAHRYRIKRCSAHMDGLLPEGPQKKRHLREPHRFILGLPLNDVQASPLVVWPGSHLVMRRAFKDALDGVSPHDWGDLDITDIYQMARRDVLGNGDPVPIRMRPGQAVLLDRHLIHGVAPWDGEANDRRAVAYFRPLFRDVSEWV